MRWIVRGLLALVALACLVLGVVYAGSEWMIRKSHAAPLPAIAADRSPAGVAEGARIASVMGCRGCHGPNGNGVLLADVPGVIHVATPALARAAAGYSDAELARLIHHGIKRDGSGVYVMPVEGHARIADEDVARIIGWLRTLKPSPADRTDGLRFGPMGRLAILLGKLKPEVDARPLASARRNADVGEYIAQSACASCHSLTEPREAHDDGRRVPPLLEVGPAYDLPAFRTLLRTGAGMSPRDLGLMKRVAKGDLSHLTDGEIAALHAYLKREAEKQPAK
ncbi:c-type cytochrome [Sphingomonas sp. MMS12-HWE2-04]|uniref:c-type cytochrome n=1 Tax=Sphingomonas sp. MMS12-HWE2-04 TaxID=3234199 RepID=UPI00384B64AD